MSNSSQPCWDNKYIRVHMLWVMGSVILRCSVSRSSVGCHVTDVNVVTASPHGSKVRRAGCGFTNVQKLSGKHHVQVRLECE